MWRLLDRPKTQVAAEINALVETLLAAGREKLAAKRRAEEAKRRIEAEQADAKAEAHWQKLMTCILDNVPQEIVAAANLMRPDDFTEDTRSYVFSVSVPQCTVVERTFSAQYAMHGKILWTAHNKWTVATYEKMHSYNGCKSTGGLYCGRKTGRSAVEVEDVGVALAIAAEAYVEQNSILAELAAIEEAYKAAPKTQVQEPAKSADAIFFDALRSALGIDVIEQRLENLEMAEN